MYGRKFEIFDFLFCLKLLILAKLPNHGYFYQLWIV